MNKFEQIELVHYMIFIAATNSSEKQQSCRANHVVTVLNIRTTSCRRDYNIGYYHEPVVHGMDYPQLILEHDDRG